MDPPLLDARSGRGARTPSGCSNRSAAARFPTSMPRRLQLSVRQRVLAVTIQHIQIQQGSKLHVNQSKRYDILIVSHISERRNDSITCRYICHLLWLGDDKAHQGTSVAAY